MAPRLQLQALLELILENTNVYFQPPASVKMQYPCIVYKRDNAKTEFAGNKPYTHNRRYMVTVIDRDPDSEIPDKIAELPKCNTLRFFTANNLHHSVFNLYF